MQGTVFVAKEQLEADVRLFLENQIDWLVLTTGMGTSALIDVADPRRGSPFIRVVGIPNADC